MDNQFKRKIVGMMKPDGHRHMSLQEATLCERCQPRVLKAKELYDNVVKKDPNIIKRPDPDFKPSEELQKMREDLDERIKYDKLYKDHIDLSFKGTEEEKKREVERSNSGFYEKNSDWRKMQL